MKKYLAAYGLWLLGVLSAAAVAFYYYRKVMALGDEAIEAELKGSSPPHGPRVPTPEEPEAPASLEDARPPSIDEVIRRRTSG
jgi:hypothetical protein